MCTMLSRSGRTSPEGKLTQRFDIPVSEDLAGLVNRALGEQFVMAQTVVQKTVSGQSEESRGGQ